MSAVTPDPRDPNLRHHGSAPQCRYQCGQVVTHYCEDCASGPTGMSGYFCSFHAARHDALVRDNGGSIFAKELR